LVRQESFPAPSAGSDFDNTLIPFIGVKRRRLSPVKLIVGLGNPGEQYQLSRHNAGFLTVDHLAQQHDISLKKQGFDSFFGKGKIAHEAVFLAKPQTYMNLSGIALEKLFSYFKLAIEDLIVIHDDLDMAFQTIRLKAGGGDGGHKGLMSIASYLGNSDFLRVRIGIGKPIRKTMVEKYVLSPFSEEELEALPHVVATASAAVREIVLKDIQSAMRLYHGKIADGADSHVVNKVKS
jgi:PTH1 family peptidyl-tRNA hydrolase